MKIITIGVYGYTKEAFFEALQSAGVEVFYDIRWRRGVRGSKYVFANVQRLAAHLEHRGIEYFHRKDLAPPPEIRRIQYQADEAKRVTKRQRDTLSPAFVAAYRKNILSGFDPQAFIDDIPEGTRVAALFCVEGEPAACHRSLVAEELAQISGIEVEHLTPEAKED